MKDSLYKWWVDNGRLAQYPAENLYRKNGKPCGHFTTLDFRYLIKEFREGYKPKNEELTIITGGCFHYPHHDEKFISCFLQVMDYVKPDECILLGDIKDNAHHSRHNTALEALRLEARKGKKGFREFLQEFINRAKTTRYIRGNHEAWIDSKKELDITLLEDETFDVPDELGFADLDIKYYPEFYEYKNVMFEHGNYFGVADASAKKQMLDEFKSGFSVHTHREGDYRHTTRTDEYVWHILGCGCKLRMWYDLKGKPRFRSGWNQSFAVIKFIGKRFHTNIIRVIDGQCIYDGKLFIG